MKRFVSLLLCALMLISVMPAGVVAGAAEGFAGGSGTADDPYLISTAEELDNVRDHPGAYYRLTEDIEFTDGDFAEGGRFYNEGLGFLPIGDGETPFSGHFDGAGHRIVNLQVHEHPLYAGLFGYNAGTIADLTMDGGRIRAAHASDTGLRSYVGAIAAYNSGVIKDCHNGAAISSTSPFDSSITAYYYSYTGGIAGMNEGEVTTCTNTAYISSGYSYYSNTYAYAGGMVGINYGLVTHCNNIGEVSIGGYSTQVGQSGSGGIVGYNDGDVTYSENNGHVYSAMSSGKNGGPVAYAGGIVGYNNDYVALSTNRGLTEAHARRKSGSSSAPAYSGGIVGANNDRVEYCNNVGEVKADTGEYFAMSSASSGGIAGINLNNGKYATSYSPEVPNTSLITCCYNAGAVSAGAYGTTNPTYCTAYSGGITGSNSAYISLCYNVGEVSYRSVGGYGIGVMGGITAYNNCVITDCYNAGTITSGPADTYSELTVGGIAAKNYRSISRAYNVGEIRPTSTPKYMGGVVGYNYDADVKNCYYLNNVITGIDSNFDNYSDNVASAVRCTDGQMMAEPTFEGFDFENVWSFGLSSFYSYPQLISNPPAKAREVSVLSAPESITYIEGLTPSLSGISLKVSFWDGTSLTVTPTLDMLDGFDPDTFEPQTLRFKVDNAASDETITITKVEKSVSYIDVTVLPTGHTFVETQTLDPTGSTFKVYYNNGTCETLDLSEADDISYEVKLGSIPVTVTYKGCTDVFYATVIRRAPESLTVELPDKTVYHEGEEFDTTGMSVLVHFNDGSTEPTEHINYYIDHVSGDTYRVHVYYSSAAYNFEITITPHEYFDTTDGEYHWTECSVCGAKYGVEEHYYENGCDADCEYCGEVREAVTHSYENGCDADCNVCGEVRTPDDHVYDNACDHDCNECGRGRTAERHQYDNACDTDCNVCGTEREVGEHVYNNACDTDCNTCGETRAVGEHVYDHDCDEFCNECNADRITYHDFGEYVYNGDATYEEDGTKTRSCNVCGFPETIPAEGTKLEKELVDSSLLFNDVERGSWYQPYIDYAVTYGLLGGAGNGTMAPMRTMTRAEFVQALANLTGMDTSDKNVDAGFNDVKSGAWYAPAVKWASENNIVNGVGGGNFAPNAPISREQMCTMLIRFIENYLKLPLEEKNPGKVFADDAQISSWAKDAVYKCQVGGLVGGMTQTEFVPKAEANRASVATIMSRFHEQYMK